MSSKITTWLSLIFAAILATTALGAPEPPKILAPYLLNGELTFDDIGWVRWKFSKSRVDHERWKQVLSWSKSISEMQRAKADDAAARFGVSLDGPHSDLMSSNCFGNSSCIRIYIVDRSPPTAKDWKSFQSAYRQALPVFEGYQLAVSAAKDWALHAFPQSTLAGQIQARTIAEQLHRRNYALLPVSSDQESLLAFRSPIAISVSVAAKELLQNLVGIEFVTEDSSNTAWFKEILRKSGWPAPTDIGSEAWEAAWRIVRHSDNDPAFQLEALEALRVLVEKQQLSKPAYATRVDHILPDVTGKQRYGTQVICKGGAPTLVPVENPSDLDSLRAEAGLPTLAEQNAMIPKDFCKASSFAGAKS